MWAGTRKGLGRGGPEGLVSEVKGQAMLTCSSTWQISTEPF